MKHLFLNLALTLALCATSLSATPDRLPAADTHIVQVEPTRGADGKHLPADGDFSDGEFERADQPEHGLKTGSDVVVVSGAAVVLVVVCVVLLILLL